MAIVPSVSSLVEYDLAVPLPLYAQIIEVKECAFWGVDNPDDTQPGCRKIWTKFERDMVARALADAQEEIEREVRFPLSPKWYSDERQDWGCKFFLSNWGRIQAAGIKATTTIQSGASVDHTNDPAVIGPIATTVTDENEIFIYHPGLDVTIIPSSVNISGGNVTIEIPRCRMVTQDDANNDEDGLDYSDTAPGGPFEQTVDVKRVYNDTSTNAEIVWAKNQCSCGTCEETTQSACMYINNAKLGIIEISPATWNGSGWSASSLVNCLCREPSLLRLNYKAGNSSLTVQERDAIIRLAHSKLPDEICGCETWSRFWKRDRNVPDVLQRERVNNPFGLNDGAWIAWRFVQQFRLVRGGLAL